MENTSGLIWDQIAGLQFEMPANMLLVGLFIFEYHCLLCGPIDTLQFIVNLFYHVRDCNLCNVRIPFMVSHCFTAIALFHCHLSILTQTLNNLKEVSP